MSCMHFVLWFNVSYIGGHNEHGSRGHFRLSDLVQG
jgi:hypothetical protein